jgi:hypothetical protein
MNLLDWLGRLIDRLDSDHEARAAQKARLDAEQDVTPYEFRIANMKHDAAELLAAAQAGELDSDEWAGMTLIAIALTLAQAAAHRLGRIDPGFTEAIAEDMASRLRRRES